MEKVKEETREKEGKKREIGRISRRRTNKRGEKKERKKEREREREREKKKKRKKNNNKRECKFSPMTFIIPSPGSPSSLSLTLTLSPLPSTPLSPSAPKINTSLTHRWIGSDRHPRSSKGVPHCTTTQSFCCPRKVRKEAWKREREGGREGERRLGNKEGGR